MIKHYTFKTVLLLISGFILAYCAGAGETIHDTVSHQIEIKQNRAYPVVEPGEFDNGRMWTFEHAPFDFFREEYGIDITDEWITKARMGSVRLPNCTGSFVSSTGLVLTNHHCTRDEVAAVTKEGENLTADGFYAAQTRDERKIPNFFVDQLIAIEDVTDAIRSAEPNGFSESEALENAIMEQELRILDNYPDRDDIIVEVIGLYNGAIYSAYTFRRYNDVRLVMVPELEVGYFGGDPDNFTYPRYTLDMTFLRVYENDEPLESDYFFSWSETGASEGDAVFVVGNPGSTSRLLTVAQLEYQRDVEQYTLLGVIEDVEQAFSSFMEYDAATAASFNMDIIIFQLRNAIKAYSGGLRTLEDPMFMGRRMQSELQFMNDIQANAQTRELYGSVHDELEDIHDSKMDYADIYRALFGLQPGTILSSGILQRAILIGRAEYARNIGDRAAADRYMNLIQRTVQFPDFIERELIRSRLERIKPSFSALHEGEPNPLYLPNALQQMSKDEFVQIALNHPYLVSVEGTMQLMDEGVDRSDALIHFGLSYGPAFDRMTSVLAGLEEQEDELNRNLGRARYDLYGTSSPPDATFSPRLQDGIIASYPYNGTIAPAFTTLYGMFNRHFSHNSEAPWGLPEIWLEKRNEIDLSAQLNLVSTNDIIGGNSGSPLLSVNLELVGLIFDGNIESLSGDFIYSDETARAISVDVRAMMEALRSVYRADRIVQELTNSAN
ncbi:MAG: S46 family peptidase [Balneolales bacterium]|nr:S46 family peptidase [Balneolales bacterium]